MNARSMLFAICDEIIPQSAMLCRLDSHVGDGDHGVTVERGFRAVRARLEDCDTEIPSEVMRLAGDALAESMGGAIGPILGGFFSGAVKKLSGAQQMGVPEIEILVTSGLRRVCLIGGAQEGDRTLVDALAPAQRALVQAASAGKGLTDCLQDALAAAKQGAENTKAMVARHGRAKFLGEKSKGYVDAGAVSMCIIIEAMLKCAQTE